MPRHVPKHRTPLGCWQTAGLLPTTHRVTSRAAGARHVTMTRVARASAAKATCEASVTEGSQARLPITVCRLATFRRATAVEAPKEREPVSSYHTASHCTGISFWHGASEASLSDNFKAGVLSNLSQVEGGDDKQAYPMVVQLRTVGVSRCWTLTWGCCCLLVPATC